jgi:predicted DNA-binding transcriptional regulator AlpA
MPENNPLSEADIKEYIRQQLRESRYRNPREDRFLRASDLRKRFSISDPTIFRWTRTGKLPSPQYLNGCRVWRESDIRIAEERMLASDQRMSNRMEPQG